MSEIQTGSIEERIKKIVADKMCMTADKVRNCDRLVLDIGCDSLDLLELLMDIEDEFELEIPDEDAEKVETVQQAIDYVTANAK